MNRRNKQLGSTLLEFVFSGIPLVLLWIAVFEMGRGMWQYQTLQYAVKATGSYVAVHGNTCGIPPNQCTIKVKDVATVFKNAAAGIEPNKVKLTLTSASGTVVTCTTVASCSTNNTLWPPNSPAASPDNVMGKDFVIRVDYPFRSALSVIKNGTGVFNFMGYSRQTMAF